MAGWGSCEFSELRRLAERMDDLQAHVGEISTAMVKELAARMLDKVTRRTPVGRKPKLEGPRTERVRALPRGGGRGRSYQVLTRNGAILERYWNGYVGGNLRRSWQVGSVVRRGSAFEIEVFNTAEYASYVEYGHRTANHKGWVRGHFMMTISEQELQTIAPQILEKRIREHLGGAMK